MKTRFDYHAMSSASYTLISLCLVMACAPSGSGVRRTARLEPTQTSVKTLSVFQDENTESSIFAQQIDGPNRAEEGGLTFRIITNLQDDFEFFYIDDDGILRFTDSFLLDHEEKAGYRVSVRSEDATDTLITRVTVTVNDLNDIAPVFQPVPSSNLTVAEGSVFVNSFVATADIEGGAIRYEISGQDEAYFDINPSTGEVTSKPTTIFEADGTNAKIAYDFIITAIALAPDGNLSADAPFTLAVIDINDEPPVFTSADSASVNENSTGFSHTFLATPDVVGYTVTYAMTGGADASAFVLDSATGELTAATGTSFDYESKTSYEVIVTATVGTGDAAQSAAQTFRLIVTDLNDNAPVFTSANNATVNENSTDFSHTFVATPDVAGDTVTYAITGGDDAGDFNLTEEGVLTLDSPPDHEAKTSHVVIVTATAGSQTASQTFTLTITDLNDAPPVFTSANRATVAENSTDFSHQFVATPDVDGDTVTYAITGGDDAGDFNLTEEGVLTLNGSPDHETKISHQVIVTATAGSQTASQTFILRVTDVNDTPPVFTSANRATVAENSTDFSHTFVATPDVAGDAVTYSITGGADRDDFNLTTAGLLTLKAAPDYETKTSYEVIVTATVGTQTASQTFTLTVTDLNDNAPVFTSANSASVDENSTSFSHTFIATPDVTGDTVAYAMTGGADASAFVLDGATGELTAATGTSFDYESQSSYEVIVTATVGTGDAAQSAAQTFRLIVTDLNDNAPVFTSANNATVNENSTDFSHTFVATPDVAGDTVTYSIIGGAGNDTITLGAGTKQIIYRFTSDDNGNWAGSDGSDIIHNFTRGVDKLLFTDTNANGIESLADFVTQAQQNSHLGITLLQDDSDNYTGLVFNFDETDQNGMLQINFDNPLSDDLVNDLGLTGTSLAKSEYQHLNRILNDDILSENFDITTDVTPSDLDVL